MSINIPIKNIEKNVTLDLEPHDIIRLTSQDYCQMSNYLIGKIPEHELFNMQELNFIHSELKSDFKAPEINAKKLVIVLKATRLCNLRCTYCHSWGEGPGQTMSFETLVHSVRSILAIPNIKRMEFVWHGGEVTLLKPSFFQKLIWLQQKFKRPDQFISNSMQTNAVNISHEWLVFLKGIGMHVGISLDGIPSIHDSRRIDYRGNGTSHKVACGIKKLIEYNIPFGALIVVDRMVYNSDIKAMLDYFLKIELNDIEFLNIVPDNRTPSGEDLGSNFISYNEFISFLTKTFNIWWDGYRNNIRISQFNEFIDAIKKPDFKLKSCYWSENCSQEVITLEPGGHVSPCDKFVGDTGSDYGSLIKKDLATLLLNSEHNRQAITEENSSRHRMKNCRWFSICQGGCPHDRVITERHMLYDNNHATCCGTNKLLEAIEIKLMKAPDLY